MEKLCLHNKSFASVLEPTHFQKYTLLKANGSRFQFSALFTVSLQLGELLDNVRHFHLSYECSSVLATKVFEGGLYQRVGKYMFFPSNWLTDWYVGLCD